VLQVIVPWSLVHPLGRACAAIAPVVPKANNDIEPSNVNKAVRDIVSSLSNAGLYRKKSAAASWVPYTFGYRLGVPLDISGIYLSHAGLSPDLQKERSG
jgi:hypothetical protein